MKEYFGYAQDVLSGRICACELVRLACGRFFDLMLNEDYEFREDAVDDKIRFFSYLKHFKAQYSGKPFVLEGWQQWVIASIYGFYRRDDGSRLIQTVYLEVARKNGKTALAAGIGLNELVNVGEDGAEVYFAANSKDQVKLSAWPLVEGFSRGLDPKGRLLSVFRDMVTFKRRHSWLKVLASDSTKLDGPNPSAFILDEYHAARDNSLKGVLESGQGMRENPLAVVITTAGFDKLGPCYALRTAATEVVRGLKQDDSMFCAIYTLDTGDDWRDEKVWVKSNPNLGVTVRPQFLRKEVQRAINSPTEEVNIKTKNLNVWCDSSEVWVQDDYIMRASADVDLKDYTNCDAYAGIDLSATSDLTCVAYMIPREGGRFVFKVNYYLPESALTEKRFKAQYSEWWRAGWLTLTPGNVTDYDYILNDLCDTGQVLNLVDISYDAWNATQFVINATGRGLNMVPFGQNIGNFNRPTKEMERLLLSGMATVDSNGINRHCFRNVVMARDYNGNIKPSKKFEEKKIDGVIGMLEALGAYLVNPQYSTTL